MMWTKQDNLHTLRASSFFNRRTLGAFTWPSGEGAVAVGSGGGGGVSHGVVFLVAAVSKAAGSQLCFSPPPRIF